MRKYLRLFLIVAVLGALACALLLTAGASEVTATTYSQVYVGEYESTDGSGKTGEATIVFGSVSDASNGFGIIVEQYAQDDDKYATALKTVYFPGLANRIGGDGIFGIALYDLEVGYYKAYAYAGAPADGVYGSATTFSYGIANCTVTFNHADGNGTQTIYTVPVGSKITAPQMQRDNWHFVSWSNGAVAVNVTTTVTANATYNAIWSYQPGNYPEFASITAQGSPMTVIGPDLTAKVDLSGGKAAVMSFDVTESFTILAGESGNGVSGGIVLSAIGSGNQWRNNMTALYPIVYGRSRQHATSIPYQLQGTWADSSTLTKVGSDVFHYNEFMTAGTSVKIVYRPYIDADNMGYIHVYSKVSGSGDAYALTTGLEGLSQGDAKTNYMPLLFVGDGAKFSLGLANFNASIDADGDISTADDLTEIDGIDVCGVGTGSARFANIETDYLNSTQKYKINFAKNGFSAVLAHDYQNAYGAEAVLEYDVLTGIPSNSYGNTHQGFGMYTWGNAGELCAASFSGRPFLGLYHNPGYADVTSTNHFKAFSSNVNYYGDGSGTPAMNNPVAGTDTTGYSNSAGMTYGYDPNYMLNKILKTGNTVKIVYTHDDPTTADKVDGYLRVYVKAIGADDSTYVKAWWMENIPSDQIGQSATNLWNKEKVRLTFLYHNGAAYVNGRNFTINNIRNYSKSFDGTTKYYQAPNYAKDAGDGTYTYFTDNNSAGSFTPVE